MSFVRDSKSACSECGDMMGIFTCRGCSTDFCLSHAKIHREKVDKRMVDIVRDHNDIKQSLTGQTTERLRGSLMKQIDQWEQQSTDKIHQVANETRQQLLITVRNHTDNLKNRMTPLSEDLSQAVQQKMFDETDLKTWSGELDIIRRFIDGEAIKIDQDDHHSPLITRISINDTTIELFEQSMHESHHEQHDDPQNFESYPNIEEKNGYSLGEHVRRFKIEQYREDSIIFLGIISKTASNFSDTYKNPTFYGWSGKNLVYLSGIPEPDYDGYQSDFQTNDIFAITINCNRERISLINERTNRKYDLAVDLTKCPFPWQLNVCLVLESK